ncbi:MAG: ATP-binding protein [Bacteriovoracaceae bacterium]
MKLYITLILTAVFLAFLAGYYGLSWRGNNEATPDDIVRVIQSKVHFQKTHRPSAFLNISKLFNNSEFVELIKPFPNNHRNELDMARRKYSSNKSCFSNVLTLINSLKENKVLKWEEYRCRVSNQLSDSFFKKAPYMHPSGVSYAFLALMTKDAPYNSKEWIYNHLNYFHASELKDVRAFIGALPVEFSILADFNKASLTSISKGKDYFLTSHYFFARILNPSSPFSLEYGIYPKKTLDTFLKRQPFELVKFVDGHECFFRDGPYCWRYNTSYLLKNSDKSNLIFAFLCIALVIFLSWILYYKIKQQKLEDENKRFALRVLTHEFRTPISSMLLQIERVQKGFSTLGHDLQESFLRLSNDVYRLQRLTESSRNYLKAQNKNNFQSSPHFDCHSVNDFVINIVEGFEEDIQVELLKEDSHFKMDTFWVALILRNLIENACVHGKAPVKVTVKKNKKNNLILTVEDEGECHFNNFNEMAQEFVKGDVSQGSGLGMNIVKNSLKKINATIDFKKNPTRFIVKIPFIKSKES